MRELNLIPYSIRIKRERQLRLRNYIALGIIMFCVLFICVYIPKVENLRLRNKEISLSQQVSLNSKFIEENKKTISQIDQINEYTNKINSITKQKVLVSDRIKEIQKYVPKDVILTNFNYAKNVVTLIGTTTDYNSIAEFEANLQSIDNLKSSKIISINNTVSASSSKYSFTININY